MKLSDSERGSIRKLRSRMGELLDKASEEPDNFTTRHIRDIVETIEALERALEAEHHPS